MRHLPFDVICDIHIYFYHYCYYNYIVSLISKHLLVYKRMLAHTCDIRLYILTIERGAQFGLAYEIVDIAEGTRHIMPVPRGLQSVQFDVSTVLKAGAIRLRGAGLRGYLPVGEYSRPAAIYPFPYTLCVCIGQS